MEAAPTKVTELEGTWELLITLRSCQTGAPLNTFRAMSAFSCGGTVMESRASDALPIATFGQGFWRHIGGPLYAAVVKLFRFNHDGSFAGIERFTHSIALSDCGNEFNSTASVQIFDSDDTLVRTGCGTAKARRLE